jgi:hypothetical protein
MDLELRIPASGDAPERTAYKLVVGLGAVPSAAPPAPPIIPR